MTSLLVPPGDSRPRPTCHDCGAIAYVNPKIVVAALLYEGDRVLWMRRATPPYAGCWTVPAGFAECGETMPEAASREIREETGLTIEPSGWTLYGVLSLPDIDEVYISLSAPLPGHNYAPSSEAVELRMFARDEIADLVLGYPPPTYELLMGAYDALAREELHIARGRMWEIRGRDPAADLPSNTSP